MGYTQSGFINRKAQSERHWFRSEGTGGGGPVLVLGGAGYIGSMLVRRLLSAGKRVRVLDNLLYGGSALDAILDHPDLELRVGDCRESRDVASALKGVGAVVHLAAIVGDEVCKQHPQAALATNYEATTMLADLCHKAKIRRFLFASSCSVYGATDQLADEQSEVRPVSLYAQTKVDSEVVLSSASSDTFQPVLLRLATVFGLSYRPRFDLAVNLLTAKACCEGVITIFNGDSWRPFIHVRDVAEAFMGFLALPEETMGGVFNVGDSQMNYQIGDVGQHIQRAVTSARVETVASNDCRNYRVSFDKLFQHTGFRCRVALDDGIQEVKQAIENRSISDYKDVQYDNRRCLESRAALAVAPSTC
jgi:nucleoside-diphosphate-sugar epimerase